MQHAREPAPAAPAERRRRPFKVWDHRRLNKKAVMVSSLGQLIAKGREKLQYEVGVALSAVLETDGTTVDDGEYFDTLPDNTVFLLLRDGDRWWPPGVDTLRAALTCIPRIVCQTMQALDLRDEAPSWKIADNAGHVTVQLHWQASGRSGHPERRGHLVVRGVGETPSEPGPTPPPVPPPVPPHGAPPPYPSRPRLTRQGSSAETTSVHVHTAECGGRHHHHHHPARGSPTGQCDFHCCALHQGGAAVVASTRSAATSPIHQAVGAGAVRRPALMRIKSDETTRAEVTTTAATGEESSESDAENTVNEEGTSEKMLLLVDQLNVQRTRYLTIKDIGVILERLSSKILDVERLEREKEGDDCHNWTLKATIRGDTLRDIGLVYHGHYHSVSEHPQYLRLSGASAPTEPEPEPVPEPVPEPAPQQPPSPSPASAQ